MTENRVAFPGMGFRPMFLAAGTWSALAASLWLGALGGVIEIPSQFSPTQWHAHEMIFGFALAAIGGFLLTAIPNWTGRAPVQGVPLALLFAAWVLGRAAVTFSAETGPAVAAVLDLAYPVALTAIAFREIAAGGNRRNLPVAGIVSVFVLANVLVHCEAMGWAETGSLGLRLAIATLALLVTLIGGRVVPAFTRNWLASRGEGTQPAPFGRIDRAAILLTAIAGLAWTIWPERMETGVLSLAAGATHAIRLARWRFWRTLTDPLLWVLHLGYFWLAVGFVLIGLALVSEFGTPAAALHALTAGAFGTMILAVMTRASLGHAGRELVAGPGTIACYLLVTAAVLLRVLAPGQSDLLFASGVLWIAGYGLFAVLYLPLFMGAAPSE